MNYSGEKSRLVLDIVLANDPSASRLPHPSAELGVSDHSVNGRGESGGVIRSHKETLLPVRYRFGDATGLTRDSGHATREALEHREVHLLSPQIRGNRRYDLDVGRPPVLEQGIGRDSIADESDPLQQGRISPPCSLLQQPVNASLEWSAADHRQLDR